MNSALLDLLWRESIGEFRRLWRRIFTWKGILVALAILAFLGSMVMLRFLSSSLLGGELGGGHESQTWVTPDRVRSFGPLITLAMAVPAGLSGRALYFRPPEVDWLFQAPLSRRDLVLYNVLWRARISLLSAFWVALLLWLPASSYGQQLVGCALWLLFSQIAGQLLSVLRAWMGERFSLPARAVLYGAVLLVVVGGAWRSYALLSETGVAALQAFVRTPFVWGLTWPARPAFEVLVGSSFSGRLVWTAAGVGVLATLVWLLARFDFALREAGVERTRRVQQRIAQMRAGGGALASAPLGRLRVPPLPYLGGAGPLAWRQALELVRNPRGVLTLLFMVALGAVAVLFVAAIGDAGAIPPRALAWSSVGAIVMAATVANQSLALDFRRDLDRMALLKSLPVTPLAMAVGQLGVAAGFLALVQGLAILGISVATGGFGAAVLLAIALLLLPASWMNVCLDNLIFLWMPHRSVIEDPGDVGFAGRLMAMMLLKLLALIGVAALAVLVGVAAHLALGSLPIALAAVGVLMVAACLPLTLGVAAAFRRFRL